MKSFLQGKKTHSMPSLRVPPGLAASGPARSARSAEATRKQEGCATGEPQVEVVKEGDRVVRLIVTCSCGERVELECLYPAGG
jgi:hypothetical protein